METLKLTTFAASTPFETNLALLHSQLEDTLQIVKTNIEGIQNQKANERPAVESRIDRRKHVFCTLITDDTYFPGVQMLAFSINKHINSKSRVLTSSQLRRGDNSDLAEDKSFEYDIDGPIQLVVLCTSNVSKVTLIQLKKLPNTILKIVSGIANPSELKEENRTASWTGSGYSKLYIWTLIEYQLVFYIDADCLVVSSDILEGFNIMLENQSIEMAAAPDIFPPDNFNAGVLIIRPNM